jgi:acetylornithine deacetylase
MTSALLSDSQLLARLVGFDSTSHRSNVPIADFVCEYLDRPGIEVLRMADESADRVNVIVRLAPASRGGAGGGAGLVLCGHLDVVPAQEPDWTGDPFTLVERDGRLIGRGACDMKGFNALAMNVAASLDAKSLSHPLALVFTYGEEIGSIGARRLVDTWPADQPLPRAAIIGEPTSLRVVRMHKGHLTMRITFRGQPAHSGSPHLGVNAIEPAGEVLNAIASLRSELERERAETSRFFSQVPHPVLAVTRIAGGEALNVIPERCAIELGLRLLPGQEAEVYVQRVIGRSREAAGGFGGSIEIDVLNENPPLLTEEHAPMHRALCEHIGQSESIGVSYASDGGWLSRLGMDCVLFGPGTIEAAHRADEWLPIDEFDCAKSVLNAMVQRFCT